MNQSTHSFIKDERRAAFKGVPVWDLPVRLFHWGLVATVTIALVTGFLAPEWWLDVHVWAGSAMGLLVAFRLIWGFAGSRYAKFSSFIFSPRKTIAHIKSFLKGKSDHYTGHNPAGAAMVFALLFVLIGLVITGGIVLGGQENLGALASLVSFNVGSETVEIHQLLSYGLLGLIGAHVAGMLVESRISKENLARAMVTGRKMNLKDFPIIMNRRIIAGRAAIITTFVLAIGLGGNWLLGSMPNSAFANPAPNETYASECGDCHFAYSPALLPKKSWAGIMSGLSDHFGEDASLDDETTAALAAWLNDNASDKWDTEAANNLRKVSAANPLAITETPYWKLRHGVINKSVFAQSNIGSKSNCNACHQDAETGRFDDAQIAIPDKPTPKSSQDNS